MWSWLQYTNVTGVLLKKDMNWIYSFGGKTLKLKENGMKAVKFIGGHPEYEIIY